MHTSVGRLAGVVAYVFPTRGAAQIVPHLSRVEVLESNLHDEPRPEEMQNEEKDQEPVEDVVRREHGVGYLGRIHGRAANNPEWEDVVASEQPEESEA